MRELAAKIDARLERWLIAAFYGYFCLIILVEVARRYLFGASSQWGEMTARYAFVYLVYVALAEAARNRGHIRIDLVPQLLPAKARFVLYVYFDLLYLLLAALVIYCSLDVVRLSWENNTLMTGFDVNMAFAQAALPLGWSLLGYRVVQRFFRTLAEYRSRGEVPLGGTVLGD